MDGLEQAIMYRKEGQLEQAKKLIMQALQEQPNDPYTLLEAGYVHDQMELAPQAINYYEQALDNGLFGDHRKDGLLCLGSSYRAVGLYEKAKETLEIGMSEFPSCNEMYIFFAMTLYNLGDYDLAMEILLSKLAETSSDGGIQKYEEAIKFYSTRLDETFN
ncbi:tetratricopeptide repeat protein [Halalkalibacillus sediminis]|nr:tetratricopeptide repeat protein [Halalkalibacillus sediminis]